MSIKSSSILFFFLSDTCSTLPPEGFMYFIRTSYREVGVRGMEVCI